MTAPTVTPVLSHADLLHLVSEHVKAGLPAPTAFHVQGAGLSRTAPDDSRIFAIDFQTGAELESWRPVFGCSRPTEFLPAADSVIVNTYRSGFEGWYVSLTAYDQTGEFAHRCVTR